MANPFDQFDTQPSQNNVQANPFDQFDSNTGDIISSSIIKGAAGLAGLPADLLTMAGSALGVKPEFAQYLGKDAIIKGIEKLTGTPLYRPEGDVERYAGKAIEGAISTPGRLPIMAMGAASGVGGEFGNEMAGTPGAIAGSIAPYVIPAVAVKAIGGLSDLVRGRTTDIRAGGVLRDVSAGNPAIEASMVGKPDTLTAAQAAAAADDPLWSALGVRAEANRARPFTTKENMAVANRAATLASVKPDLKGAVTARETATAPLYDAARRGMAPVDTTAVLARIDDTLYRNSGNTELVSAMKSIRSGLVDDTGNIITNPERVMSVIDGVKAKLASKDNKFILEKLIDTREGLKNAVPGLPTADAEFRRLSQPVNQSQVIQTMQDTLNNYKGGERVQPFLNVLGRGEQALLKKSTGFPRYQTGDLGKVLTPQQMDAVTKVEQELVRDARLAELAGAGKTDLANILSKDASKFRLPMWLNRYVTAANKGLDIAEETLNAKTMAKVYEAMESPSKALKLINEIPTSERSAFIKKLIELKKMPKEVRAAQEMSQREY